MRFTLCLGGMLALSVGVADPRPALAQDAVVRIEQRQFRPGAGRITFSEVRVGAQNPVYPPSLYGGAAGSPTLSFGGHFAGRRIAGPGECPRGAAPTGCLAGTPSAPLALSRTGPPAVVKEDTSVPAGTSPILVGMPYGNGPVAILFDRDVAAVGLDAAGLDAVGSTAITVYDRQGQVIGRAINRGLGSEFLALATRDLAPRIAGLEFHLVGAEPAGFGVDNIRFGAPEQVDLPGVQPPPRRPVILP